MQNQLLAQYINNAHSANARGEFSNAAKLCKQALQLSSEVPQAWFNLGIAMSGLGKQAKAVEAYENARIRSLGSADAQNSIGLQLIGIGKYFEAERCLNQSIKISPAFAYPYANMGKLRECQKRYEEAESFYRKAIELSPEIPLLYANLGGILNDQEKYEDAESVCKKAIELDTNLWVAWTHLSRALLGSQQYAAAEAVCRQIIASDTKIAAVWSNLGNALIALNRLEEAEAAFRQAITLDESLAATWNTLGIMLGKQGNNVAAAKCFRKCLEINPEAAFVMGQLFEANMKLCEWKSYASDIRQIQSKLNKGESVVNPFVSLQLTMDVALQRKAAEIWARELAAQYERDVGSKNLRHDKIRVAYFSADFHTHPVMHLLAEMLERHDKSRFEIFGFSFGPDKDDEMRKRVATAFDRFIEVREKSDREIAALSREMEIDIAVDLSGYTRNCRPGIFTYRAAPVQVSYLGYPGTMGLQCMDYLIADKTVIPVESQQHYSEKIVYLPCSYLVNEGSRKPVDKDFKREDMELPSEGFIYCCFNSSYKVTPVIFQSWMRILKRVEGSVIWLYSDNPEARQNLRDQAKYHGVDPGRLIFTKPLPLDEHFARHKLADLFLDTLPYNAHTTACDALWMGLPVLTCMGDSFSSRVAASLLHAIGMPELVTSALEDYEAMAIDLGHNPHKLAQIRQKLKENRVTMPLFDTPAYTKNIEAAYMAMYERYQSGLLPDHIHI